jgi:hypothetical protein
MREKRHEERSRRGESEKEGSALAVGLAERERQRGRRKQKDAHVALDNAKETNSDSAALSNIPPHDGLKAGLLYMRHALLAASSLFIRLDKRGSDVGDARSLTESGKRQVTVGV